MIIIERRTNKVYIDGLPAGKCFKISDELGNKYKVVPMIDDGRNFSEKERNDDGTFSAESMCGNCYAVFVKPAGKDDYKQVTKWYATFGYAQRMMFKISNETSIVWLAKT